jgi:hypothetical protein
MKFTEGESVTFPTFDITLAYGRVWSVKGPYTRGNIYDI